MIITIGLIIFQGDFINFTMWDVNLIVDCHQAVARFLLIMFPKIIGALWRDVGQVGGFTVFTQCFFSEDLKNSTNLNSVLRNN